VIEREQVLHVAKLARLGLSEEEVERMAGELSGILEHVDRIAELDLDDVEPTSHVVALENVLRADVPHESLSPDVALASAPDPVEGAFRVPSPQAEE
jgi:aspartyl-tRNA(Asn)/glutamyl-tRNA(Gln) amidotransferase subunit C